MLPALLLAAARPATTLRLNALFSDGGVLQRGVPVPVFGAAAPGASVRVELAGQTATATADARGRWIARLRPLAGTGPFMLSASSNGETATLRDLVVGEVWVAAGQSNMEFPEASADDYARAQAEASPMVRMFTVEKASADAPLTDLKGRWETSTPATVGRFSAVALSFARELSHRLNVPVGIVSATWGGSPAEAWTSREALVAEPSLKPLVDAYDDAQKDYPAGIAAYRKAMADFVSFKHLASNEGFMNDWQLAELDDSSWPVGPVGPFAEGFDGAAWYRKTVEVPAEWLGKPLVLSLGAVDDYDTTYFDGIRVGRYGPEEETGDASKPRRYRVAPGIVRSGKNVIAVRVFDKEGPGGLLGGDLSLGLADGSASIPLDGDWRFRVERALDPKTQIPKRPIGVGNPNVPMTLSQAMLAPMMPYAIRGALWYQGEANVDRAEEYRTLFPTLIRDWRARWGQGDFPFLFVQLPNFRAPNPAGWVDLRGAQASALSLPNTGMAVTLDLGDPADIHPPAKREVGRRLALLALGQTYREPVVYASPSFSNLTLAGGALRVEFRNGALKTTDGKAPRGFEIAGEDERWVPAEASLEGSAVVLRSAGVARPISARYAWIDNPNVNLVNMAGLPAAPFPATRV